MIGIIYKFTIKIGYKFCGCKPFYIGQHWEKTSIENFKSYKSTYWGSGSIWNDFLNKIKSEHPNNWRFFIKREVLCTLNNENKVLLNKLEEFWIRKLKADWRNNIGGCNSISSVNTINHFFSKSSKERQKNAKKKLFSSSRGDIVRKKMSDNHYDCRGKKNPSYGSRIINNGVICKRLYPGQKMPDGFEYGNLKGDKNPMYGRKIVRNISDETRKRLSERMSGDKNPMYGKASPFRGKTFSEDIRKKLSENQKEYLKVHGNPMKGRKHSEESKRKMSIVKIGKKQPMEQRERHSKAMSGLGNPMFGIKFFWITNGVENKRMPIGSKVLKGWRLGLTKRV